MRLDEDSERADGYQPRLGAEHRIRLPLGSHRTPRHIHIKTEHMPHVELKKHYSIKRFPEHRERVK